jgi:oligopeptide/dipeptide ABC transporter ATP-binding protein
VNPLLQVHDLKLSYPSGKRRLHAVRGVSFDIDRGSSVALVGESGCGKSSVAMALLHLLQPDSGEVFFDDLRLSTLPRRQLHRLRRRISIVFQNPYSALNPRMRVLDLVAEPLRTHRHLRGKTLRREVSTRLQKVGLGPEHLSRFPHEFSGGQRQRIAIARALALEPDLLVLDEPTAALDVSVQAQVLNLLEDLRADMGLSYLFITHNLAVVEKMAEQVLIMYLGRIVEAGTVESVFKVPRHPYTQALLQAIPRLDPSQRGMLRPLQGDVPSPLDLVEGCDFAPRCPLRQDICAASQPDLEGQSHRVACHFPLD